MSNLFSKNLSHDAFPEEFGLCRFVSGNTAPRRQFSWGEFLMLQQWNHGPRHINSSIVDVGIFRFLQNNSERQSLTVDMVSNTDSFYCLCCEECYWWCFFSRSRAWAMYISPGSSFPDWSDNHVYTEPDKILPVSLGWCDRSVGETLR